MISAKDVWTEFLLLFGLSRKPEPREYFGGFRGPTDAEMAEWARGARNVANDPEYRATMATQAVNMAPSAVKARRLASIARERGELKDKLAVAIQQKKKRAPIYAALRALSNEEFRLEQGK